ncbi:50S ribosomal protein L2 [candidate division WOR-3 bacterium]|nr:50S ribosomal protein L2 [candidate division WOR-3 bacterium]
MARKISRVKRYKPITPSRRFYEVIADKDVSRAKPHKALLEPLRKKGGRNNSGRITAPRRGGGEKRQYRIIDFKRDKEGIPARVVSIQYDPNRTASIALLCYRDGEYRYMLAPEGLSNGDEVVSGPQAPLRVGNALPLARIPVGIEIHNIQMFPGTRGRMVRSAGSSAQILAKEQDQTFVKLPSGEVRLFSTRCYATVGRVSNPEHSKVSMGKAGRSRHLGRRPRTRAVAMNPHDHPMGGGEGKASGGRPPCSRTGLIAKGKKTRNKKKASSRLIVRRRK